MVNFKSTLLAATIVAGTVASPAFAQQIPLPAPSTPDASLRGAGASSIQNILVRAMNCVGIDNPRGASSSPAGTLTTLTGGIFVGTPALDCRGTPDGNGGFIRDTTNLQPNAQAKYVATGSGFGRTMWRDFGNDFQGGAGATPTTGVFNPFVTAPNVWANLQYAFSDTPLSTGDLATYNTRAAPSGGAAITFPLFVLPVAIAYNPVYGTNAAGNPMVFNARGRGISVNGTPLAAIRLSKAAYCGIFNGTLTNWNHPAFRSLNINTELFDTSNDTATRWAADGAPIRLVGRMDRSGTTDIFTRHLAAVCNPTSAPGVAQTTTTTGRIINPGVPAFTGVNRFLNAAESLPYAASTGVDFRSVRGDTNYRTNITNVNVNLAGTTNSISGDYFNGTAIVNIGAGSATFPSTSGTTAAPTGNVGSGLFLLADGTARVAGAINLAPDYALNGVMLNGKITYISSDSVQPSIDSLPGLTAATLQVGVSPTLYANPTATGGRQAIGTIAPPQADSTGLYLANDTRLVRPTTGTTLVPATRANPVAWGDVLYADSANTLANPTVGYPMTGTTQVLLYTCYNGTNREQMVNTLGYILGQYARDGNGVATARGIINGVTPTAPGVVYQSNTGVVPISWARAIVNTFLSNPVAEPLLGSQNLWIQDRTLPLYQTYAAAVFYGVGSGPAPTATRPTGTLFRAERPNIRTATVANPSCATRTGA